MFKPNIVTSGLLMTGNKIKVVKKKKNPKEIPAVPVSNTMFAAPENLPYNDPAAVRRRAEERSSQRQEDQSAANKRKANPMTASQLKGKVKDAEKFHKKAGKNQRKTIKASTGRQNLATGGVRGMVKEAGDCSKTSTCAREVYEKFKKGQGGKKGKAHDKLMKSK